VELLVVVSIIALLISILLPSLRRARDAAKLIKCLAHMRGIGQAALVFADAHDQRVQLTATEAGVAYVDPDQEKFEYGDDGEILSWTVAMAQGSGIPFKNNWDWGVRASNAQMALGKEDQMNDNLEMVVCPSDKVKIASPFYPREGSLRGTGDPADPTGASSDMAYWGYLSFGINEDITGTEVGGNSTPACWRSVRGNAGWEECMGENPYNPRSPCGQGDYGRRLQGRIDKVFRPGDVGLIFETGPQERGGTTQWLANLVMSATPTASLQQYAGPYLSNFQRAQSQRMPRKRHLDSKLNVLFADMHGGTITPVKFDEQTDLPLRYAPRVRVSPYKPDGYSGTE
jgi:type II secretory pathway pseudopilin PulG